MDTEASFSRLNTVVQKFNFLQDTLFLFFFFGIRFGELWVTEEVSRGQGNNFSLLAIIEKSSLGTITFKVFLVTFWADVPGTEGRGWRQLCYLSPLHFAEALGGLRK